MRTAHWMILLLLSVLFVQQGLASSPMHGTVQTNPPPPFAPDRVLVHFKPGTAASEIGKAHRQAGGHSLKVIPGIDVQVVEVPAGTVLNTLARYRANPNVVYAEPDYYRVLIIPDEEDYTPLFGGPDRDYFQEQWGLNNTGQPLTEPDSLFSYGPLYGQPDADIDAPEGWDITTGDPAVKIAILDTGIDCSSVELAGKCIEQVNFVSQYSNTIEDIVQHGTHTAGIAAANTNNGIGVAGVGWNSSVGNLKACFEYEYDALPPLGFYVLTGVCPVSASAAAITYAADHGYHVINMSYGSDLVDVNGEPVGIPTQPNAETAAVSYAWNHGVVLVAAAGNDSNTAKVYPAANDEVIAVAATNRYDNLASFSSFGNDWVSMLAPGEKILSTIPVDFCIFYADLEGIPFDPNTEGCLTWNSGTSMASPHVAGAAALVWAHLFPGQPPGACISSGGVPCNAVVRSHLEYGADASGASAQNFLAWSQHGRLNLYSALAIVDTDVDGIPDSTDADDDNDGLSDSLEASLGTDPLLADTDGDGLTDYEEVAWGGGPSTYSPGMDLDPLRADTDGDGFGDGMEIAAGHDPLVAADTPVWGDINDDGMVNAADVLVATRAVLGLVDLTNDEAVRGNLAPLANGAPHYPPLDGPDLDLADLLLIQRKALGLTAF
jgi:thermitase